MPKKGQVKRKRRVGTINNSIYITLPITVGRKLMEDPNPEKDPVYFILEHIAAKEVRFWLPRELGWQLRDQDDTVSLKTIEAVLGEIEKEFNITIDQFTINDPILEEAR